MWPRMIVLATLVALFVVLPFGGSPSAGAAPPVIGPPVISRGHALHVPASIARGHAAHVPASIARGHADLPRALRGSWSWPVIGPHPLARPYLAPPTPYAAGHRGIDILAAAGTSVRAPDDGVVHFVGVVVDRPVLSLAHGGGVLSSFEPVSSELRAGDHVVRGEVIGTLIAGHCTTPCLHLGARIDGNYVNPLLFLGGVPWSVLLPAG